MSGDNLNATIESIFLESYQTREVPPQLLKTFKNIKFVTTTHDSRRVVRIRQDQYKNLIDFMVRRNARRIG